MKINTLAVIISMSLLSACSLLTIHASDPGSEVVSLYDDYEQVKNCQYVKEVIGSEGHWYNYLLISNRDLTQGALNDLRNRALALNSNSVHVHTNMFFTTSVTILGQAYRCNVKP